MKVLINFQESLVYSAITMMYIVRNAVEINIVLSEKDV